MRALLSALALVGALLGLCSCVGLTRTGGGQQVGSMGALQHIVYMVQENRSFDHYFGQLGQYRAANNFPRCLRYRRITILGLECCRQRHHLHSFHMATTCVEEFSDDWMESHVDMNENHPGSSTILFDGFVHIAGAYAKFFGE